jgi:hypothetical protein
VKNIPSESGFCSIFSEQAGESLTGSAPFAEWYMVLETHEPFGKHAFEESQIPDQVKNFLIEKLQMFNNSRLLLGHGPHQPFPDGPRFFLARTTNPEPALYEFKLGSFDDLLQINFHALYTNSPACAVYRRHEPIYLVCTNGKRDPCCAKFGLPIFNEVKMLRPDSTWQSSHIGGHRYGPLLLILPNGLLYGRLGTFDARETVESFSRGEIYLPRLRGRSAYPQPAQAAEILIRQANAQFKLDDLNLLETKELSPRTWRVRFIHPKSGEITEVTVEAENTETSVFESCLSEKQTLIKNYSLGKENE